MNKKVYSYVNISKIYLYIYICIYIYVVLIHTDQPHQRLGQQRIPSHHVTSLCLTCKVSQRNIWDRHGDLCLFYTFQFLRHNLLIIHFFLTKSWKLLVAIHEKGTLNSEANYKRTSKENKQILVFHGVPRIHPPKKRVQKNNYSLAPHYIYLPILVGKYIKNPGRSEPNRSPIITV